MHQPYNNYKQRYQQRNKHNADSTGQLYKSKVDITEDSV